MPRAEQVNDGDVIEFLEGEPETIVCCDCGLAHTITLVRLASEGTKAPPKIAHLRWERNNRSTGQARRHLIRKGLLEKIGGKK